VARMLDAGRIAEAMAAARALRASFPDDLAVRQAYESAQQAYEAEPFIREQITLSRQLMDKGMTMQAGAACRKVLALDDRNREALDLLSQIEDQQAPAAAVVSPDAQNESLGFILEDREEPHDDPTSVLQPLPRAEESVSGGLFEFQQNEEDLDLSLSSMDFGKGGTETGVPSSSTPAGHPGGPPGTDADPDADGPAHAASDHAIPEDFEFHAEGEQATSVPARKEIKELLESARKDLSDGKLDSAVGTVSRALALDPDSDEASQLLERARGEVERQAMEIEDLMDQVHHCLDREKPEEAEEFLRRVLALRPDHREAQELLERATRDRQRAEAGSDLATMSGADSPPLLATRASGERQEGGQEPHESLRPIGLERGKTTAVTNPLHSRSVTQRFGHQKISLSRLVFLISFLVLTSLAAAGFAYWKVSNPSVAPQRSPGTMPGRPQRLHTRKPDPGSSPGQQAAAASAAAKRASLQELSPGELVREGRKAFQSGRTAEAAEDLRAAVAADPNNAEARDLLHQTVERLDKEQRLRKEMDEATRAFQDKRYEDTLRILYRLPESLQKGEVERYKRNAWYNMGVDALQASDTRAAINDFREVLDISPGDARAADAKKMAESYADRQKDAAYIHFANSLVPRTIDAR